MNRIILLLTALLLFNYCTLQTPRKKGIDIQVNILKKLTLNEIKYSKDTLGKAYYSLSIDIFNNTDSIMYFWTMSCSWEVNWFFNTESLHIFVGDCNFNSPIIKQIESGKKLTYKSIVCVNENLDIIKELKVGFLLIHKNEMSGGDDIYKVLRRKLNRQQDIIWSDPFKIDK